MAICKWLKCALFCLWLVMLVLGGCAPQVREPLRVCPGKDSASEALQYLTQNPQKITPLKVNGICRLQYYDPDGKRHRENIPVIIWFNPPSQIRLQGDVAFNPKGIVVGSNEKEFWMAFKPKELGNSYYWGRWDRQDKGNVFRFDPELLLEAFGVITFDSDENWSLSNQGPFDILTREDAKGGINKKIYVDSCSYRIRKIEYPDANGRIAFLVEQKYNKDSSVPELIEVSYRNDDGTEDSLKITLKHTKSMVFTERKRHLYFGRPRPRGFKNIYEIINGEITSNNSN